MRVLFSFLLTISISAFGQAAQQQTNYAIESIRSLEHYRETMIPTYMNDFGELARYRQANAALSAPKPGEHRVIFFGDSITDGWHLDEYFPGEGYINRGISGQTTSQMLLRFHQDVLALEPAVVVVLAGTNDIAGNTGPISLPDIEANFSSMAELARSNGVKMIISSVTPVHNYTPEAQNFFLQRDPAKILTLNAWLKDYCAKNGLVYLDYFSAMVDDRGLLRENLAGDGLHPVDAGYRIMASLAKNAIERALK
ncbi:MAG: SGNH/GDSL hydrolase family protein [Acidobacteriaceae bacterium]|nr:SGNH/GDSL hydrolase family protein [Acidobacteriaceae bacterium]